MFKTDQEKFWADEFGNDYVARSRGSRLVASNISLFSQVLAYAERIESVIEFGANIGLNLVALHGLLPEASLSAVEINARAAEELGRLGFLNEIFNTSLLEFKPRRKYDLTFTKGVLIHINPEFLEQAYGLLYESSSRYVLVAEYYNPTPVSVAYRGHADRLFKRDFAGELMDRYPDLRLVRYGFVYHRDPVFPADDLTWFLLEKSGAGQ